MSRILGWLRRNERALSGLTLLGGFLFDAYFFRRIDLPFENIAIILHFVVGFFAMIVLHVATSRFAHLRISRWVSASFPLILQFAIGGLFGKFFIFFFKSGSVIVSWPVLAVLLFLAIANERVRGHYARLNFSLGVFYTALLVYCTIAAPIFLESISAASFIAGGIVSLVIIASIIALIHYFSHDINPREERWLFGIIVGVFLLFNGMYFANILPPIPLALKEAGVYHGIARTAPGVYEGRVEARSWIPFQNQVFHRVHTEPVYVFTAVFAPPHLQATVVHVWQYQNQKGEWVTTQSIPIEIVGGRDGGYRGYSLRSNAQAGLWRVDVETEDGKLLGRVKFQIEEVVTSPDTKLVTL